MHRPYIDKSINRYGTYLGSAQKEDLSSSGTIRVTFKYLAIATMSHICQANSDVREMEIYMRNSR